MADLYTSMVRAKQELNGGILPAMMPIPEDARVIINPKFTPGLGAVTEHPEKGLRCPVRGCGKWFQVLSLHANQQHADIGGADAIKRALQIPRSAPLVSTRNRAWRRSNAQQMIARGTWVGFTADDGRKRGGGSSEAWRFAARARTSIGMKNLTNRCDAQIRQRFAAMYDAIGRSPTFNEACSLDQGCVSACIRLFGSWNNAKAQLGYDIFERHASRRGKKVFTRDMVIDALREWYDVHGRLPRLREAEHPLRTPRIPTREPIYEAFGVRDWHEAMRIAAAILGVRDGRYGLPA